MKRFERPVKDTEHTEITTFTLLCRKLSQGAQIRTLMGEERRRGSCGYYLVNDLHVCIAERVSVFM